MPIMDGREATRRIRAFESTRPGRRRALIVGLTPFPVFSPNVSGLPDDGFDLLMQKPLRLGELYEMFLGGPQTNLVTLYGSLTDEEKRAYPRSLVVEAKLGNDPRSIAIRNEIRRRIEADDRDNRQNRATYFFLKAIVKVHNAAELLSAASPPSFNLDSIALFAALLAKSFSSAAAAATSSTTSDSESRRDSRLDYHLDYRYHLSRLDLCSAYSYWPLRFYDLRHVFTGTVSAPALPPYPFSMSSSRARRGVPATPRVISPSPTPSDPSETPQNGSAYLGPVTRSAARRRQTGSATPIPQLPIQENPNESESESDPELRRARTRSRSPIKARKIKALAKAKPDAEPSLSPIDDEGAVNLADSATKSSNGLLAPPSLAPGASIGWNWRDFSRSPSPLGLIPIHRHFQTLIHKHEVPRKALHVSIGFFVYWLYVTGTQTSAVPPYLMAALIPIASVDFLRHHYPSLNRFYVRCLGALMRETEYAGWNGVIFYLLGAWIVLRFFPKDVAVVSVMLLSWCDTAASTFGRLYGRYTPRIRRGKSLAGSLAAFLVGVATAGWFWGILAPQTGPFPGDDQHPFMFQGILRLPAFAAKMLGLDEPASLKGPIALGIMSLWSGLVAAGSEVIDLFGWDDNLTIPVLSGVGIWGFLKVFG
ncbi:hypothetical protein F5Y10DRAFT_288874 [Nemania abortiva]|nr:hypothetical protein F5Y10DRAFT_288874 [Nemania abortiva]